MKRYRLWVQAGYGDPVEMSVVAHPSCALDAIELLAHVQHLEILDIAPAIPKVAA